MSWTYTTSGSAVSKAGKNVDVEITTSGSVLTAWSDASESKIDVETRRDWLTNFSTLPTAIKNQLDAISSAEIAKKIINFDADAVGRNTAQLRLNVLDDEVREGIRVLKDFKSNSIRAP